MWKKHKKTLLNYIIIEKTIDIQEINIPQPNSKNIKELIEYQNIYQFNIQKITTTHYEQAYKEASLLTKQIINDKKNSKLNTENLQRKNKIREKITDKHKITSTEYTEEMKRKQGTPKTNTKKDKTGDNQMSIDIWIK